MAAGLFIALAFGLMMLLKNFVFNKIDDLVVSTNDIDKLIALGQHYSSKFQLSVSEAAFVKVLKLDPYNITATSLLADLVLGQAKTKELTLKVVALYKRLYDHYYQNGSENTFKLTNELKTTLAYSMYKYGYLKNCMGNVEDARLLKEISFKNQQFVTEYKEFIDNLPYLLEVKPVRKLSADNRFKNFS